MNNLRDLLFYKHPQSSRANHFSETAAACIVSSRCYVTERYLLLYNCTIQSVQLLVYSPNCWDRMQTASAGIAEQDGSESTRVAGYDRSSASRLNQIAFVDRFDVMSIGDFCSSDCSASSALTGTSSATK